MVSLPHFVLSVIVTGITNKQGMYYFACGELLSFVKPVALKRKKTRPCFNMLCANLPLYYVQICVPYDDKCGQLLPPGHSTGKKTKRFEIMKLFLIHWHKLTEYGQE